MQRCLGLLALMGGLAALTCSGAAAQNPGDRFKDCEHCPEMVVIPPGAFTMGSPKSEAGREPFEGPQFQVRIGKPLAVGRIEITVDQFTAFVRDTGHDTGSRCMVTIDVLLGKITNVDGMSYGKPGYSQTGSHPAVCVNWNDATAYVDWLSRRTGKPYRLLSESEWEYAARAGTTTRYGFGDDESALCRYGNVADKVLAASPLIKRIPSPPVIDAVPCEDGHAQAAPVGQFTPNAFGLHDVHGNVEEWLQDCSIIMDTGSGYRPNHPKDGAPALTGNCTQRGTRGGSWLSEANSVRSAQRGGIHATIRSDSIGFRVARPVD